MACERNAKQICRLNGGKSVSVWFSILISFMFHRSIFRCDVLRISPHCTHDNAPSDQSVRCKCVCWRVKFLHQIYCLFRWVFGVHRQFAHFIIYTGILNKKNFCSPFRFSCLSWWNWCTHLTWMEHINPIIFEWLV